METIAKEDEISRTNATRPETLLPGDREQGAVGVSWPGASVLVLG